MGIAQVELTSHDGFGRQRAEELVDQPVGLNRNSQTATTATLAVTYGT